MNFLLFKTFRPDHQLAKQKNFTIKAFASDEKFFPIRVFIEYKGEHFEVGPNQTKSIHIEEVETWGDINRVFNSFKIPDEYFPIKDKYHLKEIIKYLYPEELI